MAAPATAQQSVSLTVTVKNHRFQPATTCARQRPIMLHVKNLDATPMEFESVSLRVEKVVVAGGEGIIRLHAGARPL